VSVSLGFQSVGLGLGKFQLNHKGSFARCTQACVSRQLFNNDISRSKYSCGAHPQRLERKTVQTRFEPVHPPKSSPAEAQG
jgi:hypothetical protein